MPEMILYTVRDCWLRQGMEVYKGLRRICESGPVSGSLGSGFLGGQAAPGLALSPGPCWGDGRCPYSSPGQGYRGIEKAAHWEQRGFSWGGAGLPPCGRARGLGTGAQDLGLTTGSVERAALGGGHPEVG